MSYRILALAPLLMIALLAEAGDNHRFAPPSQGAIPPWQHPAADALLLTKKWDDLSPDEKRRVREAKERYRNLPEQKQERLREKWENMPKRERDKYKLERRYQ